MKVDIENYMGGAFCYSYKSNGEDVVIRVEITDECEFQIDGKPIGLNEDDFKDCENIEDCTLLIAKHVIKNNDSTVLTTFISDSGLPLTEVEFEKTLNKNLEFVTEENSWLLNLYTGGDYQNTTLFQCVNLEDDNIESVIELFRTNDTEGLHDFLFDSCDDSYQVFNLWGDTECERLGYEVLDENGKEVSGGTLLVSEFNVFDYNLDSQFPYMVDKKNSSKYILIHQDVLNRSWVSFSVPKNFSVGGIEFLREEIIEDRILYWEHFGDTITTINSFKYCGKIYSCNDGGDNGTYGTDNFALFKWNEEHNRYELIYETRD